MSSRSPSQKQLNNELRSAARDGDIGKATDLLLRGANLNYQDDIGRTALHWACAVNRPAFVRFLLANRASTDIQTKINYTPLHIACYTGSLSCAQLLVEAGCDTEIKNCGGETAIETSANCGHEDVKEFLSIQSKNQQQIDMFNGAIKSKGRRTQVLAHATFQGNARCGKTSLCNVLSGKSANHHQTSTGVVVKPVRIELHHSTKAMVVDDMIWTLLETLDEETALMVKGVIPVDVAPTKETRSSCQPLIESFSGSQQERCRMEGVVKKALQEAGIKIKHLKNSWTLYLSDIGGQVEFQELIPALTTGLSLHIIVIRASRGLNNLCHVEYLHRDGKSAHSYIANYTVKEELLQSLSTIMSTGRDGLLPKAIVVLTFRDKVTDKQIHEMDEELQKTVKETDAFRCGVIEFASESQLSHPINNLSPDDSDTLRIRKTIQRIIQNNKAFHVTFPYSWHYLSIALREVRDRVLSYDTCLKIAGICGIDDKVELNAALDFLHKIGVIRHFSKDTTLCDIVITDPQLLFDNVSELVINTFKFDHCQLSTVEEFKKKGIFPAEMVDGISTGSDLFTSRKFVDFLKHYHIIAPIKEDGIIKRYLLPCSLVHADTDKSVSASGAFPPLMITFDCGYIPRGLFGFLVTDLLDLRDEDKFSICLDEHVIYRNQITLSIGPYQDQFQFFVSSSYLRIDVHLSTVDHKKIPLSAICSFIHKRVICGLRKIIANLNYTCSTRPFLAFLCPDPSDNKDPHPATITYHDGEPVALKCTLTKTSYNLPEGYQLWFNMEYIYPSTPCIDGSSGWSSLTIGRILNDFGLTDEQLDRLIVEADLFYLAECFGAWTMYTGNPGLQLTRGEQHTIAADPNQVNNLMKMKEALKIWRSRDLFSATFRNLILMLLKLNEGEVAMQTSEYIKRSTGCLTGDSSLSEYMELL